MGRELNSALQSHRILRANSLTLGSQARLVLLQTPHVPPSLAQCLQYLQFLHALQGSEPVHVAEYKFVTEYV